MLTRLLQPIYVTWLLTSHIRIVPSPNRLPPSVLPGTCFRKTNSTNAVGGGNSEAVACLARSARSRPVQELSLHRTFKSQVGQEDPWKHLFYLSAPVPSKPILLQRIRFVSRFWKQSHEGTIWPSLAQQKLPGIFFAQEAPGIFVVINVRPWNHPTQLRCLAFELWDTPHVTCLQRSAREC